MAVNRGLLAWLLMLVGVAVAALGVGLIYMPAGLIVAGVALAAAGLLAVDVERGERR